MLSYNNIFNTGTTPFTPSTFVQLSKEPASKDQTELSGGDPWPPPPRDLVSDTEKVLPVFHEHQVQLNSVSAPEHRADLWFISSLFADFL